MALGASRRKRPKSAKISASEPDAGQADHASAGQGEVAEMKRMQPRRGEGPYSMARLERAVEHLVEGQSVLLARIDALEAALSDRDRLVADLKKQVSVSNDKRAHALECIDRMLDELDELEGRAESAAFPRVHEPGNADESGAERS